VLELKAMGWTDRGVSAATGVPVNTIRSRRNHGLPRRGKRAPRVGDYCRLCGQEEHDFAALPRETYSYLLGIYLGDGWLTANGPSWMLRVALDEAYPGIVVSCCDAIERLRGRRPTPRMHHSGSRCLIVGST
jgi:hypothetical protein